MTILTLDQGTTGTTALLIGLDQKVITKAYSAFAQIYPQPGYVEHDPEAIWQTVLSTLVDLRNNAPSAYAAIDTIGITNQRETTVLWDRATGKALHNAIVWQCRRTAAHCEALKEAGLADEFKARTGLVLDAYFSGTKVAWLLDHIPDGRRRAEAGELAFGTIDSWLIHRLSGGKAHATDTTNASRTLLANIETGTWDPWCCKQLGVPEQVLPEVMDSDAFFAVTRGVEGLPDGIPINGVLGDQQAALFGQACFSPGAAKCTFGTGAFLLANCGDSPVFSSHGLLTTPAWRVGGQTTYALEGATFIAGAAVQWLRDELGMIDSAADIEALAGAVEDSAGVTFVPALAGLGAPHWRPDARGALLGLTRGSNRNHIARAVLDGIALQIVDLLSAVAGDRAQAIDTLRVDGGAAANNLLMQTQADLLGVTVDRPPMLEATGLGAALVAGLGAGHFSSLDTIADGWQLQQRFRPQKDDGWRNRQKERWANAVERC
jgi:glycerol kinase